MENMYEQQVHRGSFIKEVYRPNPQQMQIYEAEEKETAEVSFDEAAGRVSADFIFLYPPGIPLIGSRGGHHRRILLKDFAPVSV